MIVHEIFERIEHGHKRGIVFAAGGSADIILAKTIAEALVQQGCPTVDLAQPLNCHALSEKGLRSETGDFYALVPEDRLDPDRVLRHYKSVCSDRHPEHRRGKGLSISSSLAWDYGVRYVCAAHGEGPYSLARRSNAGVPYYDFAVGVDGGGDVLTHGDDEFDRVVVDGFRSGWTSTRALLLVAMGLGADGGSEPTESRNASLAGWTQVASTRVDNDFGAYLERELEQLGLWHHAPETWDKDDPYWGYGLKVPQIVALAVRNEFPFAARRQRPRPVPATTRAEANGQTASPRSSHIYE